MSTRRVHHILKPANLKGELLPKFCGYPRECISSAASIISEGLEAFGTLFPRKGARDGNFLNELRIRDLVFSQRGFSVDPKFMCRR